MEFLRAARKIVIYGLFDTLYIRQLLLFQLESTVLLYTFELRKLDHQLTIKTQFGYQTPMDTHNIIKFPTDDYDMNNAKLSRKNHSYDLIFTCLPLTIARQLTVIR